MPLVNPAELPRRGYPTGVYGPEDFDNVVREQDINPGDDPSWVTGPVLDMSENWVPIDCVVGGTQWFREHAEVYLPLEPKEDLEAWGRRVMHATMAPFTQRIAEQAAGLILRKSIQLQPKNDGEELDPYWEAFQSDVDGFGTDVNAFARRVVISSVLYGHAAVLVDYPSTEAAPNLEAERSWGLRPYFLHVDAKNILGWRKDEGSPIAPIRQIRISELVSEAIGMFGDKIIRQIRVMEPGRWQIYRQAGDGDGESASSWYVHAEGTTSLDVIPLCPTYSGKIGELISKPPLLPIANLNIQFAQHAADLAHSLHVAAMPILVLQGFDDSEGVIGLSANSAILMPPEGKAYYVQPANTAFQAQENFLDKLQEQISSLGISTLFAQKMSAETAKSKEISRADSDSLLAVVSKDLEQALQNAFNMAGSFAGVEPPLVTISRDFDLGVLDGPQIQNYLQLYLNDTITQETLLQMLKDGEVLPQIEVEAEVEATLNQKLDNMEMIASADNAGADIGVEDQVGVRED